MTVDGNTAQVKHTAELKNTAQLKNTVPKVPIIIEKNMTFPETDISQTQNCVF